MNCLEVDFIAAPFVDSYTEELHIAVVIGRPCMTCTAAVVHADLRADPSSAVPFPAELHKDIGNRVVQRARAWVPFSNIKAKSAFSRSGGGEVAIVEVERL